MASTDGKFDENRVTYYEDLEGNMIPHEPGHCVPIGPLDTRWDPITDLYDYEHFKDFITSPESDSYDDTQETSYPQHSWDSVTEEVSSSSVDPNNCESETNDKCSWDYLPNKLKKDLEWQNGEFIGLVSHLLQTHNNSNDLINKEETIHEQEVAVKESKATRNGWVTFE